MRPELTREYSRRLGILTADQLQAALDRFGLGEILDARPTAHGLTSQNVLLTTTLADFVLRGNPLTPDQLHRERFFSQVLCERSSVPVPWPYQIDDSTDLFGWPYALMPRLPGVPTGQPEARLALSPASKLGLARAAAETLAAIHEIVQGHTGEYDRALDDIRPHTRDYAEIVVDRIRERIAGCAARGTASGADIAWTESVLARGRDALGVPMRPSLVHGAFSERNTVADQRFGAWCISGVFGLRSARVGDPEEDLMFAIATYRDEDTALARCFLETYTEKRHLRPGFRERFPVYMLADRLERWRELTRTRGLDARHPPFRDWARLHVNLRPWAL